MDAEICRHCRHRNGAQRAQLALSDTPLTEPDYDRPCFYEAYYIHQHPEVGQAIRDGEFSSGEEHFEVVGRALGLQCRWVEPRRIDAAAYCLRYPDADAAIRQGQFESAAAHWAAVGNREGRWFYPGGEQEGKKRLVFIAGTDYANIMTQWARAIREHSNRLHAVCICLRPHKFGYELAHDLDLAGQPGSPGRGGLWLDGVTVERLAAVRNCLELADYVVQADELRSLEVLDLFKAYTGIDLVERLRKEKIAIYHAGTAFRRDSSHRNQRDAEFLAQLTHPDLYRLGGANARPAFPVLESIPSPQEIRTRFESDRLILLHTPSNPAVKGTATIRDIVQRVKAELPERAIEYREVTGVSNREILKQKRLAHIHIDQFNDLGEQGVGGIGVSTFEGWEAGNLVLSSVNHIIPTAWRAWRVDPQNLPLVDLGTETNGFLKTLIALCRRPNSDLAELAIAHGRLAFESFGPPNSAQYFEEVFEPQSPTKLPVPATRIGADRAVLVVPYWPSPGLFHKRRYAEVLRSAFDAEPLLVTSEEGLYEQIMAHKPRLVVTMNLPLYTVYSDRLIHQLPRSVKLVSWHEDLRRQMHPNLPAVLDRSDAVISVLRQAVLTPSQFPELAPKLWRLPWFVPGTIRPYEINRRPLRKCLFPGIVQRQRPLRVRAAREIPAESMTRLDHPGYGKSSYTHDVVGQDFYDLIHRHAACLVDGGIYQYVVAKYVEVPYTGSLMIAEDLPDLEEMGYRAGQHFLAVDERTNLADLVEDVLTHLQDYYEIREAGHALIRERHTEQARAAEARLMALEIRQNLGLR